MTITKNCVVKLDYSVYDTNKKILDSGAEPLVYLHGGYNDIFEKIEKLLEGKQISDTLSVELSPEESFGAYNADLVITENRNEFDEHIFIGEKFEEMSEDDDEEEKITYVIKEIHKDRVVLDGNHPLAGKDIIFEATVMDVRKATEKEIEEGYAR